MRTACLVALLVLANAASAQVPTNTAGPYGISRPATNPIAAQRAAALRVAARSSTPAPGPAQVKPFSGVSTGPTISPYLNLFREEAADAIPNYFTFVRPQQQQQEVAQAQQAQLMQLQRQVQRVGYARPTTGVAGGARFGDTGRYYGGWRR